MEQHTKASGAEMKFAIVIEPTETGFSAYAPDLPGCIATGADLDEITRNMREAIDFHLEGLREEGMNVPVPSCRIEYVETRAV